MTWEADEAPDDITFEAALAFTGCHMTTKPGPDGTTMTAICATHGQLCQNAHGGWSSAPAKVTLTVSRDDLLNAINRRPA